MNPSRSQRMDQRAGRAAFRVDLVLVALIVPVSVRSIPAWAQTSAYTIMDLGTFGGDRTVALDINEQGQVVGSSRTPDGQSHAFLWDKVDGMRNLGVLPGFTRSKATGVNNLGQVVGTNTLVSEGRSVTHVFIWLPVPAYGLPAGMTDLGASGSTGNEAANISDRGQVVGSFALPSGETRAHIWDAGVRTDLGTLGPNLDGIEWSQSTGINNLGQIIGSSSATGADVPQAFLWLPEPAYGLPVGLTDIGTLEPNPPRPFAQGPSLTRAQGINNLGQVVGGSKAITLPSTFLDHAFLWLPEPAYGLPAGINDLGVLRFDGSGIFSAFTSGASAINDLGQVVGFTGRTVPDPTYVSIIWDPIHGMRPLNDLLPADSGWNLIGGRRGDGPSAINNRGQIAGTEIIDGERRAYLMEPDLSCDDRNSERDLADGAGPDCTDPVILDGCEADCNQNGLADVCEIALGQETDCNGNGMPDSCEIIETFEPIIVLDEDFATDVFPPPGWTTQIEQGPATWQWTTVAADVFLGSGAALHPFEPEDAQFDTWLLSPEIELIEGNFAVWTLGCFGQPWCPNYTVEVMMVVGEPGGTDDVRIGALDDIWTNNFDRFDFGVADLEPLAPDGPFRIGFHYVGLGGAEALIDNVRVTAGDEAPINDQNRGGVLDECARGDFDADGDVDLSDLLLLQSCFAGADQTVAAECRDIDMDGDNDVDLADLVSFLARLTGAQ